MKHPLIQHLYPDSAVRGLLRLWEERATFLDALDRLPQTFCHRDAFAGNLFALHGVDSREQMGAIDWANTGVGALGEEPAALVGGSLVFFEIEASAARSLDELAFTEYLDGLRDAGWHENPQVVRFGYAAALALRYGLGGALDVQIAADESTHEWAEEVLGHSIQEMLERDAVNNALQLDQK
jgi:hypothetical protein